MPSHAWDLMLECMASTPFLRPEPEKVSMPDVPTVEFNMSRGVILQGLHSNDKCWKQSPSENHAEVIVESKMAGGTSQGSSQSRFFRGLRVRGFRVAGKEFGSIGLRMRRSSVFMAPIQFNHPHLQPCCPRVTHADLHGSSWIYRCVGRR